MLAPVLAPVLAVVLAAFAAVGAAGAGASAPDASAARAPAPRVPVLLYTSDWSGTRQVYALHRLGARPAVGQLTRGRPPRCPAGSPCGFDRVTPSPDGRRLAYWDFVSQGRFEWHLFVAAADGASRRRVGASTTLFRGAAWSPDSRRLAYAAGNGIHVVRADGSGDVELPRNGAGGTPDGTRETDPGWSPDGRHLAYRNDSTVFVRDRRLRPLTTVAGDAYAWSPSGRWLAIRDGEDVFVLRPDGSGRRRVAAEASFGPVAWSVGDRYVAFRHRNGLAVVARATGALRRLALDGEFAWSPTRPLLAVATTGATGELVLADATSGRTRVLAPERAAEPAWAPDGRSVAYRACGICGSPFWSDHDLRLVTLAGVVRTIVRTTGVAGGSVAGLVWTRAPTTRYRPVEPRRLAALGADGLTAPRPIDLVAADGDRVAYASCGHVFVWTPSSGAVTEAGSSSLDPRCNSLDYHAGFGLAQLAFAGDRVAATWVGGGNTTSWWLAATSVATGATVTLGEGSATSGGPYQPWRGALAALPTGAGDLLAFSTWTEAAVPAPTRLRVTSQAIRVAPTAGCPCPQVASSPGPLPPFDVAGGRIAAGGDNETIVYDAAGAVLRSFAVSPAAVQLDGGTVVIAVRGELRHHDLATGALLHRWSLPDVPVSPRCERLGCWRATTGRLVLDDAARGLVAYALDGSVHVVRLADGTDTTVTRGTAARFAGAGLVVVDGAELRLLPYASLPQA